MNQKIGYFLSVRKTRNTLPGSVRLLLKARKSMKSLPLTALPRALRAAEFEPVTYRVLYARALDGAIPATQDTRGRWQFNSDDLESIAESLGLKKLQAA